MRGLLPAECWEYGLRDLARGLSAACRPPGNIARRDVLSIPGLGRGIPTRSARSAIITALKALDLPPGSNVGVPLYNCPVVFKAVRAAGCTPVFIDVDPETYCMSSADLASKVSSLNAVIAVHMFGNLCDMPALLEAARGRPIIEDCAQSLGSRLDGRMAGSFGDIAVFSFRSGKYLSVGEGGALFSRDAEIRSRLNRLVSEMPVPTFADECAHCFKTYLRTLLRSRPLWGLAGSRIWSVYNRTVDFNAKSPIVTSQTFRSDLVIAIQRLATLHSAIEKQRANAEAYTRTLKVEPEMLCTEKKGTFYNRYLYPVMFPSMEDRDFIADYLLSRKIGTIKPYQDIVEVAAEHFGYRGDCPATEQFSKKLLVIPGYHSLNKKEVEYISRCLNSAWAEAKGRPGGED